MTLAQIEVLILSFNEEANIGRTLDALRWAPRVVLLDSGSTDRTLDIARTYSNVCVLMRGFDSFAQQCNFGLSQLRAEWTLSLDADYLLSTAVIDELRALDPASHAAFSAGFTYVVYGRALRASLLPPRPVLFRTSGAHYVDDGHAHRLVVDGSTGILRHTIAHDDRKPLRRWLQVQAIYAEQEAQKLIRLAPQQARGSERVRLIPGLAPPAAFLYALILRGTILDGWRGWFYALQRLLAELMILLALMDLKAQARER
jgi:glycosyltransferase involved in cell wall biosynthesis